MADVEELGGAACGADGSQSAERPAGPVEPPAEACGTRELTVQAVSDVESFARLEPVWNRLVEEAGIDHPFLSHEWMRIWWDCFGRGHELHVLVVQSDQEAIAIAPLMRSTGRMYGARVRRLQSMANVYSERFDFLLTRQPKETCHAIWKYLAAQKGSWDVLELRQLPVGSYALETLSLLAAGDGYLLGLWPSTNSPYVPLHGTWEHYTDGLDRKHRSNLRNRSKRLNQIGRVTLEIITSGEQLDNALEEGFRLEAAAWKGKAGTAICSQPVLRTFYTQFAQRAAQRGWLRLHFLTVDGRRVAFQYALAYRQKLYLLKPGYDPHYAPYSPSNLLCERVLQNAFEQGMTEFDFLGATDRWKLEWADHTRPHLWLFVFSNYLRARLLYWIKFKLVPLLRLHQLFRSLSQSLRRT